MTRSRAQAGFTLVEVMIVLAIIGIMAAIGIPSFKDLVPRIRLNNNTMVLANEIAAARVRAISKSTDFRITFNPDPANTYAIEKYDETAPGSGVWAWQSMGETKMPGTVLVGASGFTTAQMVAYASGQVNVPLGGPAAIIELRTERAMDIRKRIRVEPTGRTYVERWRGGAWTQE